MSFVPCEVCDERNWTHAIGVETIDTMPPEYEREDVYVCDVCRLALVFACPDNETWSQWCDAGTMYDRSDDHQGQFDFGMARSYIESYGIDVMV